jgi:hypothetical protein
MANRRNDANTWTAATLTHRGCLPCGVCAGHSFLLGRPNTVSADVETVALPLAATRYRTRALTAAGRSSARSGTAVSGTMLPKCGSSSYTRVMANIFHEISRVGQLCPLTEYSALS